MLRVYLTISSNDEWILERLIVETKRLTRTLIIHKIYIDLAMMLNDKSRERAAITTHNSFSSLTESSQFTHIAVHKHARTRIQRIPKICFTEQENEDTNFSRNPAKYRNISRYARSLQTTKSERRHGAGYRKRVLGPSTFTGSRSALECAFAPCSPLLSR